MYFYIYIFCPKTSMVVCCAQDPPKYGIAYNHFGGGQEGKEACEALFALCSMGSVDTMVSNFLQPLQVPACCVLFFMPAVCCMLYAACVRLYLFVYVSVRVYF